MMNLCTQEYFKFQQTYKNWCTYLWVKKLIQTAVLQESMSRVTSCFFPCGDIKRWICSLQLTQRDSLTDSYATDHSTRLIMSQRGFGFWMKEKQTSALFWRANRPHKTRKRVINKTRRAITTRNLPVQTVNALLSKNKSNWIGSDICAPRNQKLYLNSNL